MNPYAKLPRRAYWRTAVTRHLGIDGPLPDLWRPGFEIGAGDVFLTAGSCFAQHIGTALRASGLNWLIAEPGPDGLSAQTARDFGYGMFSFRTGNVYTTAMLLQWLRWMEDPATQDREIWPQGEGFHDPVRPGIEPGGFEDAEELFAARQATLAAMARGISGASVFVLTLGLTEFWRHAGTGLVYASCPGTQAGLFDPGRHVFETAGFARILADLDEIRDRLRRRNPAIRLLLTVSPVPLTATAVGGAHVLVATVQAKSVLRAAAGEFAARHGDVDYFPSYEIVTHHAFGRPMFEADGRTVTKGAVAHVMAHFLDGLGIAPEGPTTDRDLDRRERLDQALAEADAICDDLALEQHNEDSD